MARFPERSAILGSRVARNVFWLFVLSALLPLALSDWLATSVVARVARDLQERSQTQSTRQVALQVFDRLNASKGLLQLFAASSAPADAALARSAHVSHMFERLIRVDMPDPRPLSEAAAVLSAWDRSGSGSKDKTGAFVRESPENISVMLRTTENATGPPQVLMGLSVDGSLEWVGVVRGSFLWAPVAEAAFDSGWIVMDARHAVLTTHGDIDLVSGTGHGQDKQDKQLTTATGLFLQADFGSGEWEFSQRRILSDATWHGAPLGRWLTLVAAGTLLLISLLSLGQIRRTLVPLAQLEEGTKRIASGETGTRVQISGVDEFATLGSSFNVMASRIERQIQLLEGLASIDRDVLAGAPIDGVAERAIRLMRALFDGVAVRIVWLGPEGTARAAWVGHSESSSEPPEHCIETVHAADAAWFAALTSDLSGQAELPGGPPWAWPKRCDGRHESVMLPLRWDLRTQATLSVSFASHDRADVVKTAGELRDRLAVAFTARERERAMAWRAGHDSLTGLTNRLGLNEFVDAKLSSASSEATLAVLFVDLDNFKDANDSLGHDAGDAVLCEASRRLEGCLPPGALVARQGGDEFVLVLPNSDEAGAQGVAAEAVRRLALPFAIEHGDHVFGASVGVALFPAHGRTRQELMRHADMAMYAAKAGGRGRHALFESAQEDASERRLRLPGELRRALERGQLVAHYQPRVRPHDGRITSAEALIRWIHPERGLQLPGTFIPMAEESQLIEEIGRFMLDDACSRAGGWLRSIPGFQRVAVNVSARQLVSGDLPGHVLEALKKHSLAPQALELEVTESLLVGDSANARLQLAELRRIGVSIALDDFGTGFSSMAMLRDLPIDVMKIDRSFVKDLGDDASAEAITQTIATLARSLGLHLVAEGVETRRQATWLEAMGCDEFQGFLFGHAVEPGAFARSTGRGSDEHRPASDSPPMDPRSLVPHR